MDTSDDYKAQYQDRITRAMMEAIVTTSNSEELGRPVIYGDEVIGACLTIIGLMAGTSDRAATTRSIREFADECRTHIIRHTRESKEAHEKDGPNGVEVLQVKPN